MKIIKSLILVAILTGSTFFLLSVTSSKIIVKNVPPLINISTNDHAAKSGCWWDETYSGNLSVSRGVSCGSPSSLKIYYTNPYPYKVRVAFYLTNSDGSLGINAPYIVSVDSGKKRYHHNCYSNGSYTVFVARYGSNCRFP